MRFYPLVLQVVYEEVPTSKIVLKGNQTNPEVVQSCHGGKYLFEVNNIDTKQRLLAHRVTQPIGFLILFA